MTGSPDPFTGTWKLSLADSHLTSPAPRSWIQEIEITDDRVWVREEVLLAGGASINTTVAARFDGRDYPVGGSPLADTIAYTRLDSHHLSATAKKAARVTLTEMVSISPDGNTLTLTYCIVGRGGPTANSVAVFRREPGDFP